MKKFFILTFITFIISFSSFIFAVDDVEFSIFPEQTDQQKVIKDVEDISNSYDNGQWNISVRDKYKEKTKEKRSLWNKFASWILTRNDILMYIVYLVKFLSQLWLLIWAIMVIYAWYLYATQIFWWNPWNWNKAIKNAIIWVIVISASYAIMRILISMFIE